MKATPSLAVKIKSLKPGETIPLANRRERQNALDICRALWMAGVIPFKITTEPTGKNGAYVAKRPV